MVELLGGQETIPGDPAFPIALTYEQVAEATQAGWLSPAESDALAAERERQRAIIAAAEAEQAKKAELALLERTAAEAHEAYYEVGGTGYGTTPGGADVYYFDIPVVTTLLGGDPPVYEEGTFFGHDLPGLPGKDDLLLYGALAIGALALLKR